MGGIPLTFLYNRYFAIMTSIKKNILCNTIKTLLVIISDKNNNTLLMFLQHRYNMANTFTGSRPKRYHMVSFKKHKRDNGKNPFNLS